MPKEGAKRWGLLRAFLAGFLRFPKKTRKNPGKRLFTLENRQKPGFLGFSGAFPPGFPGFSYRFTGFFRPVFQSFSRFFAVFSGNFAGVSGKRKKAEKSFLLVPGRRAGRCRPGDWERGGN